MCIRDRENTTYYYAVSKSGVVSPTETYRTGDFDSVNILYVGDPQVGASKGQPQGSETLKEASGAANTAADVYKRQLLILVLVLAALAVSVHVTGFQLSVLIRGGYRFFDILKQMVPPDI